MSGNSNPRAKALIDSHEMDAWNSQRRDEYELACVCGSVCAILCVCIVRVCACVKLCVGGRWRGNGDAKSSEAFPKQHSEPAPHTLLCGTLTLFSR